MTPRKKRRLWLVGAGFACVAGATALILTFLGDQLVFFLSPSQMLAAPPGPQQAIRVGGLVETGSVYKDADGVTLHFKVTDLKASVPVTFRGLPPTLFREGQGVVAEGRRQPDGTVLATNVLAKHDETYMPREVVEALKASGRWQEGAAMPDARPITGGTP